MLEGLGFALVFEMAEDRTPASSQSPPLPPQYHYRDPHGTEVLFLAGRDVGEEGEHLPPHASRWWLSPGADPTAAQRTKEALATKYGLVWSALVSSTPDAA